MATYIDALNGDHTDGREQLNNPSRAELQEALIDRILDGMSTTALLMYAGDMMHEHFGGFTDEELVAEIQDTYPDLLENE